MTVHPPFHAFPLVRLAAAMLMVLLLPACGGASDSHATLMGSAPAPAAAPVKSGVLKAVTTRLPYTAGTILPNHIGAAALARQRVDFYAQWKALYVAQECGNGRYFVKVNADGKAVGGGTAADTITVSEAHGYGMLISVLMADEDSEAHTVFDGMVRYFHDHPASSDAGLMAWNQVKGCANAGEDKRGDASATDGDLDIAYALLLADHKWGSTGAINYKAEAQRVLRAIMAYEVHPSGKYLLLGDWARIDDDRTYEYSTRTSDFMLSHLKAFALSTGDARWQSVQDRSYAVADLMQRNFSSNTGLVPDFVYRLDGAPAPAAADFLEGPNDGNYSWNASRFPWRVALDYLIYGDRRALAMLKPINRWARAVTSNDPARFAAGYTLGGKVSEAEYDKLPFVSALGVAAMVDAGNQAWLNAVWKDLQGQTLKDNDYYGNTLKMMGMIAMSGRWDKP
ncbi:licheninase [Duganella sp. CY15W]|uniref:glycosyl hydrolase family 8 n=1 Tax=Duganella sp. CY15W TaxID=2692172 RepID=UPI00136A4A66|nr:glycosyl hydrolase family 8 [Duganella sp. CY15W]MYM28711.1 licheninase [Duganella sp. CY15W]